jgi:hypothetical protein
MKERRGRRQLSLYPSPLPSTPSSKRQVSDLLQGPSSYISAAKNAEPSYTLKSDIKWNFYKSQRIETTPIKKVINY